MEKYVCNFLAPLTHSPLSNPLQRNLYLTYHGEERIPFALYVQSSVITSNSPCQTSPSLAFTALPAELQLHILSFCSVSTLFQLMRVSSYLRKESSKLFWAHPDTYYVIEAHWLLDGAHAGYTWDDPDFLAHVQNVQVDDNRAIDFGVCPKIDVFCEPRLDCIANFWNTLRKIFPRVKKVVINRTQGPNKGRNETHSVPRVIQLLTRASPPGITTSAFVVEQVDERVDVPSSSIDSIYGSLPKWQRALYQPCPDGLWEKTKSHQDWKAVLVPARPFLGPVGRFNKIKHEASRLALEGDGLWLIMAEILYRHFNDDDEPSMSLMCTEDYCNASFQTPGEWSLHRAVMYKVPNSYQEWTQERVYRWLPEEIKAEFEHRATMLTKRQDENDQRLTEMCDEWVQISHEQQTEVRRLWVEQLENDPLWDTGAKNLKENRLWSGFCCRFPYWG